MLDAAYHVVQQHERLVVTAPPSSLFASRLGLGIFLLLWISLFWGMSAAKRSMEKLHRKYPQTFDAKNAEKRLRLGYAISTVIGIGTPLLFLAVGYTSGSITLDRNSNRATVTAKMTAFLPSQEHSIDLASVTGAILDEKPNARRIRLEASRGPDLTYPIWSDRRGQEEAVEAMNSFLKAH